MPASYAPPKPHTGKAAYLPKPKDDGANEHHEKFLIAVNFLVTNYDGGFSKSDALALTRGMELPPEEVSELFDMWTKGMVRDGHLSVMSGGPYDSEVFFSE